MSNNIKHIQADLQYRGLAVSKNGSVDLPGILCP